LLEFGGNSTSFAFPLERESFRLYIDGGTGLARHGMQLGHDAYADRFHFLITHTHWDHILGLPFFEPAYHEKNSITFYSSQTSKSTFQNLFFGLQHEGHLPIPVSKLKAHIEFKTLQPEVDFFIEDKIKVKTFQINHQGITLGYRLEYRGSCVAIITDHAPVSHGNLLGEGMKERAQTGDFENMFNDGLVRFLQHCHTVVFDTHFTEANLKADWGHSTPHMALHVCRRANVKRLILFHHAPEDTDQDVHAKVASVYHEALEAGIEVYAAKEGDEWELA
jgi:phosphoribosyl 1,2-cyclic phosphodiesterase